MYETASVLAASRKSAQALRRDIARAGVCGPFTGWTLDELVTVWLEHYGKPIPQGTARKVA